jgi:hypothetical protein
MIVAGNEADDQIGQAGMSSRARVSCGCERSRRSARRRAPSADRDEGQLAGFP